MFWKLLEAPKVRYRYLQNLTQNAESREEGFSAAFFEIGNRFGAKTGQVGQLLHCHVLGLSGFV